MNVLEIYEKLKHLPLGNKIFSFAVCKKAPYFSTISPNLELLEEGRVIFSMKNKKSVQNHLGSIHAIAMCNLAEMCAGVCMETIIGKKLRWIPKGMSVRYLERAEGKIKGDVIYPTSSLIEGSNFLVVKVTDAKDQLVFDAEIEMYVSKKKPAK